MHNGLRTSFFFENGRQCPGLIIFRLSTSNSFCGVLYNVFYQHDVHDVNDSNMNLNITYTMHFRELLHIKENWNVDELPLETLVYSLVFIFPDFGEKKIKNSYSAWGKLNVQNKWGITCYKVVMLKKKF